ncbi:hypothetical protein N7470_005846, partial [Penicillium chermesinum]
LRPGETVGTGREVRPADDKSPFAHEPKGLGTLRDVRFVATLLIKWIMLIIVVVRCREERFYLGGVLTLGGRAAKVFHYNGPEWRNEFMGNFQSCQGPRGNILDRRSPKDMVSVYPGVPKEFPPSLVGSYAATDLDGYVCVDRHSRLGAYGYGDQYHIASQSRIAGTVQWDRVNWGDLQTQCVQKNKERFEVSQTNQAHVLHALPQKPPASASASQEKPPSSNPLGQQVKKRSAIICELGMIWIGMRI